MGDIPDTPGPPTAGPGAAAAARRTAAVRTAAGLAVAALLLLWKPWLAAVAAAVALLTLLLALVSPLGAYARLERGVERFAHGVGVALSWLLLPAVYLLLFVPVGLLLRRRLRLTRRPDPRLDSYWQRPDGTGERWQGDGLERYRRQF